MAKDVYCVKSLLYGYSLHNVFWWILV